MPVEALLSDDEDARAILTAAARAADALRAGRDAVVFTSRQVISGVDARESLLIGQRISEGLVRILRGLKVRPRYLVAKGGITSSDLATRGLNVRRAMVMGQILPGVPVWRTGPESRFPELPYVIFPGNVGGPQALAELVTALRTQPEGSQTC